MPRIETEMGPELAAALSLRERQRAKRFCNAEPGRTADEAIAAAATEFNTDVKTLIAVRRYKIAQP